MKQGSKVVQKNVNQGYHFSMFFKIPKFFTELKKWPSMVFEVNLHILKNLLLYYVSIHDTYRRKKYPRKVDF